jgi:hypothetical protein
MDAVFRVLTAAVGARREKVMTSPLGLPQAAHVVAAWSLVHGFAMVLLDGRLSKTAGTTAGWSR